MPSRSLIPRETGWGPLSGIGREMGRLTDRMERMFDDFFGGEGYTPRLFRFAEPAGEWRFVPSCDLSETESQYVLRAEVPGFSKEDLHVDVTEGVITLRGDRHEEVASEGERYVCRESSATSFERSFHLPQEVSVEGVTAKVKDGVLTLTLPKARAEQARQIEVVEA